MKLREVRSAYDVDVGKAKMTRVFIPFLAIAARGKRRGGGGEVVGGNWQCHFWTYLILLLINKQKWDRI